MNLIFKFFLLISILFAKYNGVVLDDRTNLPIEDVNILYKNGGTVSDSDGFFEFTDLVVNHTSKTNSWQV